MALTVPSTAASGSDVTLTIEVQNTANSETNYAVLRFSVTAKVQLHVDLATFAPVTLSMVSKCLPGRTVFVFQCVSRKVFFHLVRGLSHRYPSQTVRLFTLNVDPDFGLTN